MRARGGGGEEGEGGGRGGEYSEDRPGRREQRGGVYRRVSYSHCPPHTHSLIKPLAALPSISQLNASDERGIAVIREKVKTFAQASVGASVGCVPVTSCVAMRRRATGAFRCIALVKCMTFAPIYRRYIPPPPPPRLLPPRSQRGPFQADHSGRGGLADAGRAGGAAAHH